MSKFAQVVEPIHVGKTHSTIFKSLLERRTFRLLLRLPYLREPVVGIRGLWSVQGAPLPPSHNCRVEDSKLRVGPCLEIRPTPLTASFPTMSQGSEARRSARTPTPSAAALQLLNDVWDKQEYESARAHSLGGNAPPAGPAIPPKKKKARKGKSKSKHARPAAPAGDRAPPAAPLHQEPAAEQGPDHSWPAHAFGSPSRRRASINANAEEEVDLPLDEDPFPAILGAPSFMKRLSGRLHR